MKNNQFPKFIFGWKGGLALFLGGIIPSMILGFINVFFMMFMKENFQYNDLFLLISNTVFWLGAIWAFDYFVCRPETGKKLNFNFSIQNFEVYLLIFPMMFGMMLIAEFITSQIPITGPFFGKMYEFFSSIMERFTNDTFLMLVMAVFMAPIFEEIVFRGIIQKGLINKGVKPIYAIWIAAFVFGLVHGNPWQFVGAVLLGFVLGIVYEKTNSLLMPILLHAFNNGISTLLVYYGKTESFSEIFHFPEWSVLVAGILIFGVFFYFFMKKYSVQNSED